jgi:hypothetical protein
VAPPWFGVIGKHDVPRVGFERRGHRLGGVDAGGDHAVAAAAELADQQFRICLTVFYQQDAKKLPSGGLNRRWRHGRLIDHRLAIG